MRLRMPHSARISSAISREGARQASGTGRESVKSLITDEDNIGVAATMLSADRGHHVVQFSTFSFSEVAPPLSRPF